MKRITTEEQWGLVAWNVKPKAVKQPKSKSVKPPRSESVIEATALSAFIGCTVGLTVNATFNAPLLWGLALMFGLAAVCGSVAWLVTHQIVSRRLRR
jgi:hypothetical protein